MEGGERWREGCGETQRFAQSANSMRIHTQTTRFLFYSLFISFLSGQFKKKGKKKKGKTENTGVLCALMF